MNWNLICQVGDGDNFLPDDRNPRLVTSFDDSGKSELSKNNIFQLLDQKGISIDENVRDLLLFAISIYTGDLRIERTFADDRWTRNISVYFPVANLEVWQAARGVAEKMLDFLTGDKWQINLRKREPIPQPQPMVAESPRFSAVSLFSGGLDSFVGAIDLLEGNNGPVALVGQYGSGSVRPSQVNSHNVLFDNYGHRAERFGFWVQPSRPGKQSNENTMRSRSLLFLALGIAVAADSDERLSLFVPENGFISLNVPLSFTRLGSLSTRTTHPFFASQFQEFLDLLGINVELTLPYRFRTKGEMLIGTQNTAVLQAGIGYTLSCSRPDAGRFQNRGPGTHCGYCVPCIIRLSSMKAAGFPLAGAAFYDVVNEHPDAATVKGADRRAFELAINRVQGMSRLQLASEVLKSGPVPTEDLGNYIGVYHRGIQEVAEYLSGD